MTDAHVTKPTHDLAFKKILASEDHKSVTQGFIADFFGLQVDADDLTITNPYSISVVEETLDDGSDERVERLYQTFRDITVDVDHLDVTVELQICKQDYFLQRAFYYAARLYTSRYHLHPGLERYSDLRPVWSMSVLGEPIFGCEHGFHMFTLRDADLGEGLDPELVRLGFFELSKSTNVTAHYHWQHFLDTGEAGEGAPFYIQEAADMISDVNLSQKERDMDALLEKFRADQYGQIASARREGRDEGLAQGRTEGLARGVRETQVANARAALGMGLAVADVAAITGLDVVAVRQLGSVA